MNASVGATKVSKLSSKCRVAVNKWLLVTKNMQKCE